MAVVFIPIRSAVAPPTFHNWLDLGVSANGLTVILTDGTDLFVSIDGGSTFANETTGGPLSGIGWTACDVSRDGSLFVATAADIYTSPDGSTWTNKTAGSAASGVGFSEVVLSTTGSSIMGADVSGNAWLSTDSGGTWTEQPDPTTFGQKFTNMAATASIATVVAGVSANRVTTTTNTGTSWANNTNPVIGQAAVAVSGDGSLFVAAAVSGSEFQTSPDNVTWTTYTSGSAGNWQGVASSTTGQYLVGTSDGDGLIYRSTAFGAGLTATAAPFLTTWGYIWSSDDGTKIKAISFGNGFWQSSDSGATWTETAI